jgi:hypothetical protein
LEAARNNTEFSRKKKRHAAIQTQRQGRLPTSIL